MGDPQQRQRRNEIPNLGAGNLNERASLKYKRAFFVDWRAADRLKKKLFSRIDFLLDTNDQQAPKLISGASFRRALQTVARRPFRVVPFFDPGPWGGQWMREVCDLPTGAPNYAWCFDCVPEENSLLLGFGSERVEIPRSTLSSYIRENCWAKLSMPDSARNSRSVLTSWIRWMAGTCRSRFIP